MDESRELTYEAYVVISQTKLGELSCPLPWKHNSQILNHWCYPCPPRQWCGEAPAVPNDNDVGVRPDTHPNALGKRRGNYLYISIPKCPVYVDKLRARGKWG